MSGIYARYILPRCLDKACGIGPIEKQRAKVVPLAKGNVLEIGIGSGLNLPHYSADQVTSVTGVDPDDHIWKRSETRRKAAPFPVERIGLSGENIPMETDSADTVVVTYTLCTIPDPVQALKEMRRILKPGGDILFTEHGMSPSAKVAKWQNRIDPVWKKLAGGCHSGRNIPEIFKQAGLETFELQEGYIPGPKILAYNYWGRAR
jgi:ubiquinone/menaquinone biosynthesis C-methylase UbiE